MPNLLGFLSFLVLVGVEIVPANNNETCEQRIIAECSRHSWGLLKALKHGNRDLLNKECDDLQATIDCLSVPRCPGNLLKSFRLLTMVAATSLSDECPNLELKTLEDYVKGHGMPCQENTFVNDECERRCRCRKGELDSCYRVRKEFTTMSFRERERFVNVLKTASADPRYKNEYEKLTTLHSRIPTKLLHHMPQVFLPWHRWFLLEFENFLRQIDCRVTIPYWDWSEDSQHWTRGSDTRDAWSPGPHGLGGNGVLPDRCVGDGPFGVGAFAVPWSVGGGCLKRNFNFSCSLPNKKDAEVLVSLDNFTTFERTIRENFHTKFHDCVGGYMSHHRTASYAPEFWLLHGFIDKLWADWQKKGNDFKFQYYTGIGFEMPGTVRFPWELLDDDTLPGDVKIVYEHPGDYYVMQKPSRG